MADKPQDEQRLIQRAKRGSLEAFNALVLMYQDQVFSTTARILGDPAAAADATQETFVSAWRRIDSYRGGSFRAWLLRIATNASYDELRRQRRRPADYIEEMPGSESDDGAPLAASSPTPENAAEQNALQQAIADCIQGLSEDQRAVIVLADVQGLPYQEVAEALNTQLGTVKSRLSRARLAVRRCLQAVQELLPDEYRLFNKENNP